MRGETFQNAMAVILVAVLIAVVPLLLNFPTWWPLYVPALMAVASAACTFLRETDVAAPRVLPGEVLPTLASRLNGAGHRAKLAAGGLTVPIDTVAAVRLRTRVTDQGTVVSCRTWATPLGGVLVAVLVALTVTAVPALALLAYLHIRTRRFAKGRVVGLLPESTSAPPSRDEIHILLVGGLSTGERLARQACEAQRSAYWDAVLDVLLAGFLAWTVVLVGLFVALNGFNLLTGRWEIPLAGATTVAAALLGSLLWGLRARYRQAISRYAEWADRLGMALARELSSRVPEPAEPSAFEMLASASEQVPDWIEAQRRAGMSADPTAAFILLTLTAMAFSLGSNAVLGFLQGNSATSLVFGPVSAGLALGAAWYARHWTRLQREQLARLRSDWDARTCALRDRMGRFLQEM